MGSRYISMRYFISFILILFCSVSLFAQNNSDTTTITLKGVTVTWKDVKVYACRIKPTILKLKPPVEIITYHSINHTNHSEFGLPMYPFRFENVNQMANTVAGVLSMDGERPSILGTRREGTAYYLNEVRILEGFLPNTEY
jgi:hypothetical protein